ncbi:MAG TPA: sulfatase-like hydrolase/transferase [Bryobacteraceae bacterium]
MDRLAREGMCFRVAFTVNALCASGRATTLTGLYSRRNGVIDNKDRPLAPGVKIVSDYLHEAGYEVAFCQNSHLKNALRDHYWDYYFGYLLQQPNP